MNRAVWLVFGALLLIAIGVGYVPDVMLARETRDARAEGLIGTPERPPVVPVAEDARLAYADALRQNAAGMNALRNDPGRQTSHPDANVQQLVAAVVEASKRPRYAVPWAKLDGDDAARWSPATASLETNLTLVALVITKTATRASDLLPAARLAVQLEESDPLRIPFPDWANVAGRVLDGADRLHLTGADRQRVVDALRPAPDFAAMLRRHVAVAYAAAETRRSGGAGGARAKRRFLAFWRGFLRDAPKDPKEFAKRIALREDGIQASDNDLGIGYLNYAYPTARTADWSTWASLTAGVLERLGQEPLAGPTPAEKPAP